MSNLAKYRIPSCYTFAFSICVSFIVIALFLDTPVNIAHNFVTIYTSRSVLITDYVALAGVSATLLNSAVSGIIFLLILIKSKSVPNGKIIAAIFLVIGFSLFGKNMFNSFPIILGVWLYGKINKIKFSDLLAQVMIAGTISPIVSEIAFLGDNTSVEKILAAYGTGIFIGLIFPIVSEATKKMHRGYCLYNGGIAGGFIATFFVGLLRSFGIELLPENFWDTTHSSFMAIFAYSLAVVLIIYGLIRNKPKTAILRYMDLLNEKDVNNNDYYAKYGTVCYINIGIMCIIATSVMLFLKAPINGPVLGGILTISGFAAAGKHPKNAIPVFIGSMAAAVLNFPDTNYPLNSLAILFSTGLAPVAGRYGWIAGIVAGFFHVSVALFIGDLNGGLNLYNNGFAGGFVVITIVPVIVFVRNYILKNTIDEHSVSANESLSRDKEQNNEDLP